MFFDDEIHSLGGKIYHVPYFNLINQFEYERVLRAFFKKHLEDKIVHGHLGSCAHIYLKIAKEYGCFAIAHSHNTLPTNKSIKNTLYRLFSLRTRKVADYFMACGKQAGIDRFGEKIVASKRYTVLNNAIDSSRYIYDPVTRERIRAELGLDDAFVLGHIGRFNYQKNHEYLIDIFSEVIKIRPAARLLLVGDGDLRPQIESKIKELGLSDKVIMTGVRKDVPDLLQAMDCFVFPSHYEGLPVTLVEAQASGLPIITSTAVTDEVDLTDLVKHISLDKEAKEWANEVIGFTENYVRIDTHDNVVSGGYDIHATAIWLEKFYMNVYKER